MVPVLGGDEGARTPDLDSAIVALSQLSYIPNKAYNSILGVSCKGLLQGVASDFLLLRV